MKRSREAMNAFGAFFQKATTPSSKFRAASTTSAFDTASHNKKAKISQPAKKPGKKRKGSIIAGKQADPSIPYIDNPLNIPCVRRASVYFLRNGVDFTPHLGTKHWRYRTHAKLAVRHDPEDGRMLIGLFAPNSHQIVECDRDRESPHHPQINIAIQEVRKACKKLGITGYDEKTGSGMLRYMVASIERATDKVQLTLVWNVCKNPKKLETNRPRGDSDKAVNYINNPNYGNPYHDEKLNELSDFLIKLSAKKKMGKRTEPFKMHSLWAHFLDASSFSNKIIGYHDHWKLLHGPDSCEEQIPVRGVHYQMPKLTFPPFVFRQANIDEFANVVSAVRKSVLEYNEKVESKVDILELYGGVGTIGLHLLDIAKTIVCSDGNPHNIKCFHKTLNKIKHNSHFNSKSHVKYIPKPAEEIVEMGILKNYEIVIVDPPRKGLDRKVLRAIENNRNIKRLIYVSCGWKAFERDCELLKSRFSLTHAEGHILFPGADHIETLAIFDRE